MTIEIPDDKLPKILKGVQDMCRDYLEQEDPAPGVGKTDNQFYWFEDLNSILYEQCKHEIKQAFENAIDNAIDVCFSKIQESFGIMYDNTPPNSKLLELQNKLTDECANTVLFQAY